MGEHSARPPSEQGKERELLRRQLDLTIADANLVPSDVDDEIPDRQDRLVGSGRSLLVVSERATRIHASNSGIEKGFVT